MDKKLANLLILLVALPSTGAFLSIINDNPWYTIIFLAVAIIVIACQIEEDPKNES